MNGRRVKFALLAMLLLGAAVFCLGGFLLLSYKAGNTNRPDLIDQEAYAWLTGVAIALLGMVASIVAAWRSRVRV